MREPSDATKPRRPAFAREFPRASELDALVDAFMAGDYARVRAEAPRLMTATDDPEVKRAAGVLRARIEADPLAKWIVLLTLLLLVFMTAWWTVHRH